MVYFVSQVLIYSKGEMMSEERKAWEKKQRENRIIDMAQDIFFKNGYEFTTIIEIAKASGYNKRSIYLYFKDKEDLFLAVVLRGLTQLHQQLEIASKDTGITDSGTTDSGTTDSGIKSHGIKGIGRAFFDFSMDHPDYLKLIMVYEANTCVYGPDMLKNPGPQVSLKSVSSRSVSPRSVSPRSVSPRSVSQGSLSRRSLCQQKTDAIADLITRFLARGIENKNIQTSLEPAQLMLLLWGQVFGVMQIILMRQTNFQETYGISYENLFDVFMDMATLSLTGASPHSS